MYLRKLTKHIVYNVSFCRFVNTNVDLNSITGVWVDSEDAFLLPFIFKNFF